MATAPTKPRLLVIKGGGGGPIGSICASLSTIAEVVLVNVATGKSWLEANSESARKALDGKGELIHVSDPESARAVILETVARNPVDGIFTPSERLLEFTADLAQELGLPHASPEVVRTTRDKFAQRAALMAGGVPCPKFARVRNLEDLEDAITAVPMPVVIKPEKGAGGIDTYQVETAEDLRKVYGIAVEHLGALGRGEPEFIVEELLQGVVWHEGEGWGDYGSVESFILDGEIMHACITDKTPLALPFRETGSIIPSSLPAHRMQEAYDCATAAIRALGITRGVTHTEIKYTPDGPRIIEVNLRLGGHLAFLSKHGIVDDVIVQAALVALGQRPAAPLRFRNYIAFLLPTPPQTEQPTHVHGIEKIPAIPHVHEMIVNHAKTYDWRLGEHGDPAIVIAAADTPEKLIEVRRVMMETLIFD